MKWVLITIAAIAVGYWLGRRRLMRLNEINRRRMLEKQQRLEKVLDSFGPDDEITNNKVEALLGVSDPTVGRYLEELEQMGKLEQIGTVGQSVKYRKI